MNRRLDFFMGALSPAGFHGYFDTLDAQDALHLYLIKAAPGCGKSTLMRCVAQKASGTVEYIHCSSDPDSLDGAILWSKNTALVDATSPHAMEPRFPCAKEDVVSLYHTLNSQTIGAHREEIIQLFHRCAGLQQQAVRHIAAAGELLEENRRTAQSFADLDRARLYARRLAARLLARKGPGASEQIRLLSAVTLKGIITFRETVSQLANNILVFHDEAGAVSPVILRELRLAALARGYQVISCWCPLAPEQKLEHLFVPQLGLAFLTGNRWHSFDFSGQRTVHCARFMDRDAIHSCRQRMRFDRRVAAELLQQASSLQQDAKQNHDLLEHFYQDASDFALVDRIRDDLLCQLHL